jgi:hypothetical protein
LALPLFLFGLIHNWLPYKLTDVLIPKISKDIEYYAPLAVLLGLFLYPIFYLGILFLVHANFWDSWYLILLFLAMPFTGLFAYFFVDYYKHVGGKWAFIFAIKNKDKKIMEMKEKRNLLKKLILED